MRKLWLIIALPIVVALVTLVWFYPSNNDFSHENPGWNGIADFTKDFKSSLLSSLDSLPPNPEETTLVIIPYLEFNDADSEKLEHYVSSGGRLIILDDYAYGNGILKHLGLEARFTGSQLLDPLFNYKNENFPKIFDFAPDTAFSEVDSIVFNHATSLENIPDEQVIARSSYFSFLDENQNGNWDKEEAKGPLPVAARFEMGKGDVLLIADPSILISSMINLDDNRQFLKNIAQGEVLIDQSHLPEVALDEAKGKLEVSHNALASIGGTLGLVMLVLALTLKPIWHKGFYKEVQ